MCIHYTDRHIHTLISEDNIFHIMCLILAAVVSLIFFSYYVNFLYSGTAVHSEQANSSDIIDDHFIVDGH